VYQNYIRVPIALLLIFMSCFTAFQAILRYAFGASVTGAEELILLAAVWVYFLGGAYATGTDAHVSGGVRFLFMNSKHMRVPAKLVRISVCIVVSIFFSYYSFDLFSSLAQNDFRSVSLALPKGLWAASFMFGSMLSTLLFVVRFVAVFFEQ